MFVVCLCLKIIFRRFTPNIIRKGLICLNLGTYIHEKALSFRGASPPWTPLGALPPDPRYSLTLRARHGLQPPKSKIPGYVAANHVMNVFAKFHSNAPNEYAVHGGASAVKEPGHSRSENPQAMSPGVWGALSSSKKLTTLF